MTFVLLVLASFAQAAELRLGLFVGNNEGRGTDQDLVFAAYDARKMRDLFVEFGQLEGGDAVLLQNDNRRNVVQTLEGFQHRIRQANERGDHTTLFFYYSGHGSDEGLHLGATLVSHDELRSLLEASGADVRVAMLDACQSGGAVRQKGGMRGPSFSFAVESTSVRGTAFLTSSAASELSQESSEVGGGFFTHYLHTALSGAADHNRDGEVTLTEAQSYVYRETLFATRETERTQTPVFDYDLTGAGSVTLTSLEANSSKLNFLGDLSGSYSVWDESRKRYVAQLDGNASNQLGVRPGTYYIHKRMPGWVDEAQYVVRRGETRTIAEEDFVSVPFEKTAARGDLNRVVRRAKMPDLAMRTFIGIRSFGDQTVVGSKYIPTHGVVGLGLRFQNNSSVTYWGADFLTGAGTGTLDFENLGQIKVGVQSYSLAANFGISTPPRLFRIGVGARAEGVIFARTFPDGTAKSQSSFGLAPGVQGWLGLHPGRWSFDFQHHLMIMAMAFTDANRHPLFGELLITVGYRF